MDIPIIDVEEENTNELPEYSDDEDFRKIMNDAIMNKLVNEPIQKDKKKKIKLEYITPIKKKTNSKHLQLGEFIKSEQKNKFIPQRKCIKRQLNPRMPPYLLVMNTMQKIPILNENDFPKL
jgi:hypothetical protein